METLKTALIVCCKQDERYIGDYLKYYKEVVRVDKVFLCDNNDYSYTPDIRETVLPYMKSGFLEYRDYRGIRDARERCYTEIYTEIKECFDWVCLFDPDEYLCLGGSDSVRSFLSQEEFAPCDCIRIPVIRMHSPQSAPHGRNISLKKQFSYPEKRFLKEKRPFPMKNIVRCRSGAAIWKIMPDRIEFDGTPPVYCLWNGKRQVDDDSDSYILSQQPYSLKSFRQHFRIHLKQYSFMKAEKDAEKNFRSRSSPEETGRSRSDVVRKRACLQRMEQLDRGLIALKSADGIFLSWRMFCTEDPVFGTAEEPAVFTLFRDGKAVAELIGRTNYMDSDGQMDSAYYVCSSAGDVSRTVRPFSSGADYFDIPLCRPADSPCGPYTINDVSAGDLDGDGVYELIVKWDSGGKDNTETGRTGNVLLDAYRLDGTRLWKYPIDLGPNIRAGAHYTQFLVYDFDRDGKSEILCKTAPGSRDGSGSYVSRASRAWPIRFCSNTCDFRNQDGMVLEGDEYLTAFHGSSGEALDTIYYPNQRISVDLWGDKEGNRSERYTAAVAWLDGSHPFGVFMRGYYWGKNRPDRARQCACAVRLDSGRLSCRHSFDTFDVNSYRNRRHSWSFTMTGRYKGVAGYRPGNELYIGEGNHNCTVADVNGDGRDEVLTGAICFGLDQDGRLSVRWCSFLGHGDALHIGAYIPAETGYELFAVHEKGGEHPLTHSELHYGMSVLDADTGKRLFFHDSPGDMGRGMMANVGAGGYYQVWGMSEVPGNKENLLIRPHMRTDKGFSPVEIPGASSNFRIFWDGDLLDELLDGGNGGPLEISSWNGTQMECIFRTEGCISINGTKSNPCLQADILGDWREELVMARADNEALRVFVSDIPTEYSFMTLMHDPVYRAGVAAEQTAYNQPPHIGFYIGRECFSSIKTKSKTTEKGKQP